MKFLSNLFRGRNYRNINEKEMERILNNNKDILILDVRDKDQYKKGHIPNAKNIPVDDLSYKINSISSYKSIGVIVYCGSGIRSQKAANYLVKQGFINIYNLQEGISAYKGTLV